MKKFHFFAKACFFCSNAYIHVICCGLICMVLYGFAFNCFLFNRLSALFFANEKFFQYEKFVEKSSYLERLFCTSLIGKNRKFSNNFFDIPVWGCKKEFENFANFLSRLNNECYLVTYTHSFVLVYTW